MEKEKEQKLTDQEKLRIERFRQKEADLVSRGYKPTLLTIDITKANTFAGLLFAGVGFLMVYFYQKNFPLIDQFRSYLDNVGLTKYFFHLAGFFFLMLALIVVHELIHGITWGAFAEGHHKAIQFGILKEKMTPYCYCQSPLNKWQYLLGALMPLIILGIIPAIFAFIRGNFFLLLIAIIMIAAASGDLMVAYKLITYRSIKNETYIFDHPIEAGLVVFEK